MHSWEYNYNYSYSKSHNLKKKNSYIWIHLNTTVELKPLIQFVTTVEFLGGKNEVLAY